VKETLDCTPPKKQLESVSNFQTSAMNIESFVEIFNDFQKFLQNPQD